MLNTMTKRIRCENGFTLIEMSLVLFVISALLLLFIPNLSGSQDSAESKSNEAFETVLQTQVNLYILNDNDKPNDFNKLKTGNYLTDKQITRAIAEYNVVNGIVSAKPK
ncbi:MAG: prepilin-type N-terminal cleavage/methylation domain-containing protein [Alkalibacterium sp.]|nr:prepilin-type N-terminal cleavage/methylation domain-containing protein [Alkalibacterium sp.]